MSDSDLAGARPTLKTISKLTGLAIATVSRALHDAPDIGAETKRRVHEVADQIGYRPNRAGVRLRTGKTNVISLVLSTDHDVMNHTARLISSVAGALRGTPYHLIVTPYFPSEDPMEPVKYIVETQSADAIILNQTQPNDPRVAWLMEKGFPFATHGRTNWCDSHPYFDFDNARFAELGVERLGARGRKHILMLAPRMDQNYAKDMVNGAQSMGRKLGVHVEILKSVSSDDGSIAAEAAVREALAADPTIDGVITASTTTCMSACAAAEDLGRVVGQDIDLFSKEAIPFLKRFRRDIQCVQEDVATAGAFLARAALKRISDPMALPMQGLDSPKL
ncbi:MAG: LacI family transcriptional regulator [Deltaproteobacteria bacterium]